MKTYLMTVLAVLSFTAGAGATDFRVANAKQIPATLSALTGVSPQQPEIATFLFSNSSRFPQFGTVEEANSSFVLAQMAYSSLFCQRLVKMEKAKAPKDRWVYGAVDFSQPFSQLSEPARLGQLVTELAQQFWSRTPTADESGIFAEEIGSWTSASDAASTGRLDFAMMSLCSVFLSAPQVWLEAL